MNELILPIVVGLIAAFPGVIAQINLRKLQDASAANEISEGASNLVKDYRMRLEEVEARSKVQSEQLEAQDLHIKRVEAEVKTLRQRMREYRKGIGILLGQMEQAEIAPRYRPPADEII